MRRLCLLLLLALTISAGVSARADADAWPITQRCFGDATPPPQDWTFDGTLLMTSTGRLHAFQQGWTTPRILVSDKQIPYRSALSPDGRWYAVIQEDKDNSLSSMVVSWYRVRAVNVYSTVTDEKYVVPWESLYAFSQQPIGHQIYWLDNENFLYSRGDAASEEWIIVNPFTQAISAWTEPLNPSAFMYFLAPDHNKALFAPDWTLDDWVLDRGDEELQLPLLNVVAWRPDSTSFAAYTRRGYNADQVVLFDADGNRLATLLDIRRGKPTRILSDKLWSPDGKQLLFSADHLYLADMESKQIVDLCVPADATRSIVWSPDGTQFVLITNQRADGIQIFDMQTWGRYIVGYHSGSVIGWRAD